jgi:hypothetical protein
VFCAFFSLCLILGLGSVASAGAEEAKEKRSRLPILGMVSVLCVSIFVFARLFLCLFLRVVCVGAPSVLILVVSPHIPLVLLSKR